ncbi:MAG TPA: uroporphyrinogen decarboxylase [Stellaceae bacterium]|nr:uroporphyrinogen decarboxylase [Stellaceae bacterium]
MSPEDKPFLRAVMGAPVAHHPFWLMRQAGRYLPEYRAIRAKARDFVQLCLTPDLATEITLQPIRRFGMDAAILFSDILLVPFSLGQELAFQEGEGPKLEPIRDRSGLTRLSEALDFERLLPVYETIRLVKQALPPETALIGFAGAPWTLATYMVEGGSSRQFAAIGSWVSRDADGFQVLIDRITTAVTAHLDRQIAAGVEAVQIFDSWAAAALPHDLKRWVYEPTRRIVASLKERWPAVPVIGFPKGIGTATAEYVRTTGVDMISVDTTLPLDFARDTLQPLAAVQGSLDPELLVTGGTAMKAAVERIVDTLGAGRFVFNLGHGVLQTTPPEHVAALAEQLRSLPVSRLG